MPAAHEPSQITFAMMRESLYAAVVSDALDSLGFKRQSPRIDLRPMTVDTVLVGRCKTTLWADMYHEDPKPYELELLAVDNAKQDDVLICAAQNSKQSALWGELLSTAAKNSGCVGAIIDGAVRDIRAMRNMSFPVFARGASVYDSLNRNRVIDLDIPVELDGVIFSPGDLVIADCDGVVVVPQKIEQEAIAKAWKKVHAENLVRDEIRGGMKAGEVFKKYGIL
jgi:4-hydroxy-4-methyl-2-oxoglutarate aldolase